MRCLTTCNTVELLKNQTVPGCPGQEEEWGTVDCRKLNDVINKKTDNTLDMLAGAKWFFTLDLKRGYWQVDVHQENRKKTAFLTRQGLWQFTVMPSGLCNTPVT
jgi:hypothetical protein